MIEWFDLPIKVLQTLNLQQHVILFIILNIIDTATTLYALYNGATELNPVMKKASDVGTPVFMAVIKILAVISVSVVMLLSGDHKMNAVMAWVNLFYAIVAVWNTANIIHHHIEKQ